MGKRGVEFDHDPVALIERVPVYGAPAIDDSHLPDGARQAVGPLHVPVVAELQHAVHAARRISQHGSQRLAPAQPATAAIAARSRSSVVSLRPQARVTQPHASSNVSDIPMRSSTVSSTLVLGGSRLGCLIWLA